jgi:hypothetical protein
VGLLQPAKQLGEAVVDLGGDGIDLGRVQGRLTVGTASTLAFAAASRTLELGRQ